MDSDNNNAHHHSVMSLLKPLGKLKPSFLGKTTDDKKVDVVEDDEEEEENKERQRIESEILSKISEEFYQEELDPMDWIKKNIPEDMDAQILESATKEKEQAHDVISSILSKKVMNNYGAFVQGMTQIHELGMDLQSSTIVCKNGRRSLNQAKEELIKNILVILSEYRRRQIYKEIVENLIHVKKILNTRKSLEQALSESNFPKAIELSIECRNLINSHKHLNCVAEIETALHDQFTVLTSKLDGALVETCRIWNPLTYERIMHGYRLLGQSSSVIEKLKVQFLEAVNSNTKNVVTTHLLMSPENIKKIELLKKMKFKDLCRVLKEDHFLSCLNTVLELLCDEMYLEWTMIQWHVQYEAKLPPDDELTIKYFNDIKDGLLNFKKNLWDEMQRRVSIMISAPAFSAVKIDEFLKVLDSVFKFVEIGEEFSEGDAHTLQNSLKFQSKAYFDNLHKARMEDLGTMFENEMWHRCPVQKNFTILDMKEFKAFRQLPVSHEPKHYRKHTNNSSNNNSTSHSVFSAFATNGNPFSKHYKQDVVEDKEENLSDEEAEEAELDVDEVEETPGESSQSSSRNSAKVLSKAEGVTLLTTSTINVLRYIGKYLHMMKVLEPIAYEIYIGITQTIDYYIYVVYSFFGEGDMEDPRGVSPRLRATLLRMHKQFSAATDSNETDSNSTKSQRFRVPKLTPMVELSNARNLYGIAARTIAIESLTFLAEAVNSLKKHLQVLLPKARERNLTEFYYQSIDIIPELTRHLYKSFALKLLNWEELVQQVCNTKWDIKEIGIDSSAYVDYIIKQLQQVNRTLLKETKGGWIPQRVRDIIWEELISHIMEQLVEGYSRCKKCTNEGRVLMALDLKNLQTGIEKIVTLRPIPKTGYVENYIKAYYQSENEILVWCKEHPEYTLQQWQNIVTVGVATSMKRNNVKMLLSQLEDLDRVRKSKK